MRLFCRRVRVLFTNVVDGDGALLGTVIGGLIGIGGSLGTFFAQQWVRRRGDVDIDASEWHLKQLADMGGYQNVVTDPSSLRDSGSLQYNTAIRIHNQKDVSVGLLELCMAFHGGQEKLMELRPEASIRYMGIQEVQKQTPFEAATLPAQEVVVIWLYGNINGPEKLAKLRQCSRVYLRARLSSEPRPRRLQLAQYD
jgi:hypothetical protein